MIDFVAHPALHLAFASLHVVVGHGASALIYRLRFGRNPLVLYTQDSAERRSPHARATRFVGLCSALWAAGLVAAALVPGFRSSLFGRPLLLAPTLAWGIAVVGLVAMVASQVSMGRAFRVGQHSGDGASELHTTGLHRLSRNPIYVGSWLFLAGMTLWYPGIFLVAMLIALGAGMHALVRAEEDFLAARFGDAYRRYAAEVPRYLGVPRRWP